MPKAQSPKRSEDPDPRPSAQDLAKVRDILFGDEVRQLSQDIHALREELRRTREELNRRIESGSAGVEEQIEGLSESIARLREENVSRVGFAEMLSRMADEVGDASSRASKRNNSASDG